jgi:hypothetical protein
MLDTCAGCRGALTSLAGKVRELPVIGQIPERLNAAAICAVPASAQKYAYYGQAAFVARREHFGAKWRKANAVDINPS